MFANEGESFVEVFVAIADTVQTGHDVIDTMDVLVRGCTMFTAAIAAGILLADSSDVLHVAASSSERASDVEEEQLGAHEGPCLDAYRSGATIEVPSIADARGTWPAFSDIAEARGYRAVHSVPIRFGSQRLGAMNLFLAEPGRLSGRDAELAEAMALYAANSVEQHRKLHSHIAVRDQMKVMLEDRVLIEQAKGTLAQRYGVPMDDAFGLLRAEARRMHASLRDTAAKIVVRPLGDGQQKMIS
ncbi:MULTISPECIES: GAF and ANTAR domain-containing protein [Cryobacterium]|uniref:GAF and ANTAR domain-containing protein n=1 Tax=Cryobacterium TaxID=69578 RepID=UPI000CD433CF|nr:MULTISPECIES: GAF and ANTAR domain-containing protein [Cryobacterium]POH66023.1 transcriptional regulator [Cryobacterium zongtaii]TFC46692.1 ANTAR domain-containing protein [Cryobacterium sp. TMN-39-2]